MLKNCRSRAEQLQGPPLADCGPKKRARSLGLRTDWPTIQSAASTCYRERRVPILASLWIVYSCERRGGDEEEGEVQVQEAGENSHDPSPRILQRKLSYTNLANPETMTNSNLEQRLRMSKQVSLSKD